MGLLIAHSKTPESTSTSFEVRQFLPLFATTKVFAIYGSHESFCVSETPCFFNMVALTIEGKELGVQWPLTLGGCVHVGTSIPDAAHPSAHFLHTNSLSMSTLLILRALPPALSLWRFYVSIRHVRPSCVRETALQSLGKLSSLASLRACRLDASRQITLEPHPILFYSGAPGYCIAPDGNDRRLYVSVRLFARFFAEAALTERVSLGFQES